MRCYSPHPQEAYSCGGSTFTHRPAPLGDIVAWNLIWLSVPVVDDLLQQDLNVVSYFARANPRATGMLCAISRFDNMAGVTIASIMGQSPIQFVQDFQDYFDLPSLLSWGILGGQAWIDCMVARAYSADGMADVYEAAAKSANVIVADFTLKRRVS